MAKTAASAPSCCRSARSPAPAQPTDAQLNALLQQHAAELTRPEARVFTVAAFSSAKLSQGLTADPAQVQKRFDFEKDALSKPERRSLVQIPVRTAAEGASVAARLAKGEAPQAVARSLNVQPIIYTDSPKSAIADKKLADIAFAMTAGQVKGPVQGDLGLAVLKLSMVTPGHEATLDEVRPKIEQEVKADTAKADINKAVQTYEDARSGGASLADAAKAAGAAVTTLPAMTAKSVTLQNQQVNMPPKLLAAGFALRPGQDSDILELAPGDTPPCAWRRSFRHPPRRWRRCVPLLTRFIMQQDVLKRLKAKADAIALAVSKGETMQVAAAANHAPLVQADHVERAAAGKTYSNELLGRIFLGKPGDVATGPDVKPGYVVAKLEAIAPATPQSAAQIAADSARPSASPRPRTSPTRCAWRPTRRSSPRSLPESPPGARRRGPGRAGPVGLDAMQLSPAPADFASTYDAGPCAGGVDAAGGRPGDAGLSLPEDRAGPPLRLPVRVGGGGAWRGRYSVITLDPDLVWRCHGDRPEVARGTDVARGATCRGPRALWPRCAPPSRRPGSICRRSCRPWPRACSGCWATT